MKLSVHVALTRDLGSTRLLITEMPPLDLPSFLRDLNAKISSTFERQY